MLKGLGCDLVEVARVEDAMKKEGFAQRVFTEQEQLYIQKKGVQTAGPAAPAPRASETPAARRFRPSGSRCPAS